MSALIGKEELHAIFADEGLWQRLGSDAADDEELLRVQGEYLAVRLGLDLEGLTAHCLGYAFKSLDDLGALGASPTVTLERDRLGAELSTAHHEGIIVGLELAKRRSA